MKPRFSARLLFAGIGAIACLLAALALEGVYARMHTSSWLSHDKIPVLLFFPHVNNDTERRLQQANANSGDVEVTLTWNNLNDLDLHCIDPAGEEIRFDHKVSVRTAGRLDVDQNMSPPYTTRPVEHIFWPHGRAPAGQYRIFVHHYARHGGQDPTHYQVTVKNYGSVTQYSGEISHGYARRATEPGKPITEFRAGAAPFAILGLPAGFWRALLVMALWTVAAAACLAGGLLAGLHLFYKRVYHRKFLDPGKPIRIAIGCAMWSGIAGAIVQALYALVPPALQQPHPTTFHVLGLALLSALVGMAIGGRVPHLHRGWAFLSGLLGGGLTGWIFIRSYWGFGESHLSETISRVLAAALLGAVIGFVIALIVVPPEPPEEPEEYEDEALSGMQPLSLRANRIGPTGKLRRAGVEPANRMGVS